jgi:hypothetical protein
MDDPRFSDEVRTLLVRAGWFPGRNVPIQPHFSEFELFEFAQRTLHEFGGLNIGEEGRGEQLARDILDFTTTDFWGLRAALLEDQPTADARTEEGLRVFPVAETCSAHITLLVDEAGRIYQYYDGLERLGDTLGDGFANVLFGRFYRAKER